VTSAEALRHTDFSFQPVHARSPFGPRRFYRLIGGGGNLRTAQARYKASADEFSASTVTDGIGPTSAVHLASAGCCNRSFLRPRNSGAASKRFSQPLD